MSDRDGVYTLTAIRLVNFHNFTDETIRVKGALFLIGDNGSGKTTLLDAVQFALTAGVGMEWNAAARMGRRLDGGRSLAGLILREDIERGVRRPDGAIGYAALELRRADGSAISLGCGAFVASIGEQPDVWGFVTPRPLGEVALTVTDPDGRVRPLDRDHLEQALGRDQVRERGRYRTLLADRLFGGRESFEQAMDLMSAAKAYRELVVQARNISGLFGKLLPPPSPEAFRDIKRSLQAIQATTVELDNLRDEQAALARLVAALQDVDRAREAQARYDYIEARTRLRRAAEERQAASDGRTAIERQRAEADGRRAEGAAREAALAAMVRELTASRGMEVAAARDAARARHAEAEGAAAAREATLGRLLSRASELGRTRTAQAAAAAQAISRMAAAAAGLRATLHPWPHLLAHADGLALLLEGAAAEPGSAAASRVDEALHALRRAGSSEAQAIDAEAASAEAARAAAATDRERIDGRLRELRRAGEVLPDVPRYQELLEALPSGSTPLYRTLELPESWRRWQPAVEALFTDRLLGAVVPTAETYDAARRTVLAHGEGLPVLDMAQLEGDVAGGATASSDTLQAVLEGPPAVRAYLARRFGAVALVAEDDPGRVGPWLSKDGVASDGRATARLPLAGARLLGAEARRRALAAEMEALSSRRAAIQAEEARHEARRHELSARAAVLRDVTEKLQASVSAIVIERHAAAIAASASALADAEHEIDRVRPEAAAARAQADAAGRTYRELERLAEEQGVGQLMARLQELHTEGDAVRRELGVAERELGALAEREREAEARLGTAERELHAAEEGTEVARAKLLGLLPERFEDREDPGAALDHYVDVVKQGSRIDLANLAELRHRAIGEESAAAERIQGADGVRHQTLWRKYAFHYDPIGNATRDPSGKGAPDALGIVSEELERLQAVLTEQNRELLERIVLESLVTSLREEVGHLERTMDGINRIVANLTFGRSRYQFVHRVKDDSRRLRELLSKVSALNPAAGQEWKDVLAERMPELTEGDEVPAVLDYRTWFSYHLRVNTKGEGDGADVTTLIARVGSGGEQAVPNYLLVMAMAALMYDGIEAGVRLLLLDEAFYGIDAGRREGLLAFAREMGLQLVVATPEMDGLTEELPESTTLLLEKSVGDDVFIQDFFHAFRRDPGLFQEPPSTDPGSYVIGKRDDGGS